MAVNNKASQDIKDRANASAKRAKALSPSIQYAIVTVLPNTINGAFWGFADMKNVESHINEIREARGNLVARKLGNACLIEANPNFFVQAVGMIDPNAVSQGNVQKMTQARAEAQVAFEKFLISKGKVSEKLGNMFGGTIGIYCTNDVTSITYKNVTYPAFRVDMTTFLGLLNKYGYHVKVGTQFVPAQQAAQMGQQLWDSAILSPTKTGIFVDIKCTLPAAKIKELEKAWKQQYGVK